MRSSMLLSSSALCLALTAPALALIDSNLAVSAGTQANGGGCHPVSINPGLLDMLTLVDPEWAAIDVGSHAPPFSDAVTLHGTVALAKVNETGDFSADHVTDDQNTFITLDAADMERVATGNVSASGGVEAGQMEVEWELGKYPLFAWAGAGDRLTGVGRWIWDCGHPSPGPAGTCSTTATQACVVDADCAPPQCLGCVAGETCTGVNFNYHSELHPPQAVAISRMHGYAFSRLARGGKRATRTDVWISPDGGGAGDACFLGHTEPSAALLGQQCFPLSQPIANVNASDFAFDIPLPPKPPGRGSPRIKVFDQTPKGFPRPGVSTTFVDGPTPVVHAVVDMTTPIGGRLPSQVGKTIVAGWRRDPTPITRLAVRVTALEIVNPLKHSAPVVTPKKRCSKTTAQDCSAAACPAGETCLTLGGPTPGWQIWLEVNGDWRELSRLADVSAPGTIRQRLRWLVALPAGDTLHLHATGKSLGCLESQLYGVSLANALALYGLTDGAACLQDTSKDVGRFDVSLAGPDFGAGRHVTASVGGDGGHCSATAGQPCLDATDCPAGETCVETGGAFELHYTITKLH